MRGWRKSISLTEYLKAWQAARCPGSPCWMEEAAFSFAGQHPLPCTEPQPPPSPPTPQSSPWCSGPVQPPAECATYLKHTVLLSSLPSSFPHPSRKPCCLPAQQGTGWSHEACLALEASPLAAGGEEGAGRVCGEVGKGLPADTGCVGHGGFAFTTKSFPFTNILF